MSTLEICAGLGIGLFAGLVMMAVNFCEGQNRQRKKDYLQRLLAAPRSQIQVWVTLHTYYDSITSSTVEDEAWLFAAIDGEEGVCLASECAEVRRISGLLRTSGILIQNAPAWMC